MTEDEGVVNIAPFSYFIGLSSGPATVLISVGHKADGTPKDTLENIRQHKKLTICTVQESDLEKMHFSSKGLTHEESEAEIFVDDEAVSDKEKLSISFKSVAGIGKSYTFLGEESDASEIP